MGDDRIAHILSEGMMKPSHGGSQSQQQMMHHQQNEDSCSNDDSNSQFNRSLSPKNVHRMRKYENDDIPREKMARIYQEELTKLMTRETFPK